MGKRVKICLFCCGGQLWILIVWDSDGAASSGRQLQDRVDLCSETVFFCVPLAPWGMLGPGLGIQAEVPTQLLHSLASYSTGASRRHCRGIVWGWVLWGWRRDGELKLDSWGRCVPVLVLLLVSVWHRLSIHSLGSSFLMCLRIWNLQWLKVLSRVSGSPNWWMGAVYCQSSDCWVNRAFLNLFLKN